MDGTEVKDNWSGCVGGLIRWLKSERRGRWQKAIISKRQEEDDQLGWTVESGSLLESHTPCQSVVGHRQYTNPLST